MLSATIIAIRPGCSGDECTCEREDELTVVGEVDDLGDELVPEVHCVIEPDGYLTHPTGRELHRAEEALIEAYDGGRK